MEALQRELDALFARRPGVIWGVAPLESGDYAADYARALVFGVPHRRILTLENWEEEALEALIGEAKGAVEGLHAELAGLLRRLGVPHAIPPVAQRDEVALEAPLSYKDAAVRAGLGWRGKNDLLITSRYGPRVRLGAVVLDAVLAPGEAVTASRCPPGCRRCVEACPCGALRDRLWAPEDLRGERIDYVRCNRMRSRSLSTMGRKEACGLCLVACAYGGR